MTTVVSIILAIVAFLAGGCLGEKNKFRLPAHVDGMIVGVLVGVAHAFIQTRFDPVYLNGNPVNTVIFPFLVFAIFGFLGWKVAYHEDEPILGTLGKP